MIPRICLVPRLSGVGGMVSFQHKLAAGLTGRGIEVCYDLADNPYQAVLVIGGTRQLAGLWRARRQHIPVVQRLDGMNWLHRLPSGGGLPRSGLRHFLRAEYGNWLLSWLRTRLASHIVYQSEFVRGWWERIRGPSLVQSTVIYNGVDLSFYTPQGPETPPPDYIRLLLVEGSLMGGYEQGLQAAVELAKQLAGKLDGTEALQVELMIVGRVPAEVEWHWESRLSQVDPEKRVKLTWFGLVGHDQIPAIDRSAHLLYSSDVNAACPNSVIEALACGLPVVAFDTGAIPELLAGDAGRVAPFGGDPWRLDPPNIPALVDAAEEILDDLTRFRLGARSRAEAAFGLDGMVDAYLEVLLGEKP